MNLTKDAVNSAIKEAISGYYFNSATPIKPAAESYDSDMGVATNVFLTSSGLYVKVVTSYDSYGGEGRIDSVSIVEPVTQSVTNYE